uniref:RNA-directed DNA polymerase n=1 Tax=Lygus hesperus TaxID=30085 RepID=A0A0A9X4Z0_LYGHE
MFGGAGHTSATPRRGRPPKTSVLALRCHWTHTLELSNTSPNWWIFKVGKRAKVRVKGQALTHGKAPDTNSVSVQVDFPESPVLRASPYSSLLLCGIANGVRCNFVVDTGASRTIMNVSLIEKANIPLTAAGPAYIRSISGERIPVKGESLSLLDIGDGIPREQLVLVAGISEDCVLGLDFLASHRCLIDPAEQVVVIDGQKVGPPLWDASLALEDVVMPNERETPNFQVLTAFGSGETADEGYKSLKHIRQLTDDAMANLPPEQGRVVGDLLNEFADVFARNNTDLGQIKGCFHSIDVGTSPPIRQAPRRLPPFRLGEVDNLVSEMERNGIVEPSQSPWASPIVLIRKKDGSTRFCVDYRQLNDVTTKDSHPLPKIDELVSSLGNSSWFSTLDLQSGYWQVPMADGDRAKTAFCTPWGLWQFKVMPFGLCNAPATFQRAMGQLFHAQIREGRVKVYLDDVLVDTTSFDEHVHWLRQVFEVLQCAGVKLNPKKCQLFSRQVSYLGYNISEEGIAADPAKTDKVRNWPVPKDRKELKSFLAFCSYYRCFVPNFAQRAAPLYGLQDGKGDYLWSEECEQAFNDVKLSLTEPPVLGHLIPGAPFILDTDACDRSVGAVLSQLQDGQEKVIAYFSKCLSRAERNYCATRRELLSVVMAVKHFRSYGLECGLVTVRSDHASLQWLKSFRELDGQLARWMEILAPYNLKVVHRPGKVHQNADGISRRPCAELNCRYCARQEEKLIVEARLTGIENSAGEWVDEQIKDTNLNVVRNWVSAGVRPSWQDVVSFGSDTKSLWAMFDSLKLKDRLLVRRWDDGKGGFLDQILVPRQLRSKVAEQAHELGHFGRRRCLHMVRRTHYWPGMTRDVKFAIASCEVCGRRGKAGTSPKAPLQTYTTGSPFERLCMDVIGPLPVTSQGNRHLVVVVDAFTKWPEAYAVPDLCAETVAKGLVDTVISRFGVPRELHTDQGRCFESAVFKEVMSLLGIHKTRTSPMHPRSDGQVERFNRTLIDMLAKVIDIRQDDWDLRLPFALLAFRASEHSSTSFSPAQLTLGRELTLPIHLITGVVPEVQSETEYGRALRDQMQVVHEIARDGN